MTYVSATIRATLAYSDIYVNPFNENFRQYEFYVKNWVWNGYTIYKTDCKLSNIRYIQYFI